MSVLTTRQNAGTLRRPIAVTFRKPCHMRDGKNAENR